MSFDEQWVIDCRSELTSVSASPGYNRSTCIFSAPKELLKEYEDAYVPRIVSIGPYHFRKEELSGMERFKGEATRRELARIQIESGNFDFRFDQLIDKIQVSRIGEILGCYDKEIPYSAEVVCWMMARDACFILEFFRCQAKRAEWSTSMDEDDPLDEPLHPIFGIKSDNHVVKSEIMRDLIKLENQIPVFVLEEVLAMEQVVATDLVLAAVERVHAAAESLLVAPEKEVVVAAESLVAPGEKVVFAAKEVLAAADKTSLLLVATEEELVAAEHILLVSEKVLIIIKRDLITVEEVSCIKKLEEAREHLKEARQNIKKDGVIEEVLFDMEEDSSKEKLKEAKEKLEEARQKVAVKKLEKAKPKLQNLLKVVFNKIYYRPFKHTTDGRSLWQNRSDDGESRRQNHILGIYYYYCLGDEKDSPEKKHAHRISFRSVEDPKEPEEKHKRFKFLSAVELNNGGVKIQAKGEKVEDISFKGGTLSIPQIKVDVDSEIYMRNLIALEICSPCGYSKRMTAFSQFMNGLCRTENGAAVMREKGVIDGNLWQHSEITRFFSSCKQSPLQPEHPSIKRTREKLLKYSTRTCRIGSAKVWKEFGNAYFLKPWLLFGGIGAFIVLLLTATQVFCLFRSCGIR